MEVSPWSVRCQSGVYLDLLHPEPSQIVISDIAAGLARSCRFAGQIPYLIEDGWYSVAEHCCHAADIALDVGEPAEVQLFCLLHDAPEAYIGDVVRPLGRALGQLAGSAWDTAILQIENGLIRALSSRIGVEIDDQHPSVRKIDDAMLHAEKARLFHPDGVDWGTPPAVVKLPANIGWSIRSAEREFLRRFDALVRTLSDER